MENSKLLELLRTLTAEELRDLQRFVRSPYFNRRAEAADLLDALEKSLKSGRPAPDKETIFRKVFGDGAYDDHRLRMAMSFLFKLTQEFLAVQAFRADTPVVQRRLAATLRLRKLPDQFDDVFVEARAARLAQPWRNADFYEEEYQLKLEKYRFDLERQTPERLNLQALSDSLDEAFLARKLWQACFMRAHQAVYQVSYDMGLLQVVMDYVQTSKALEIPAVAIYYYCYQALSAPSEKTFYRQFKSLLNQHAGLFPEAELRDLYVLALNFCIRQYNAGNAEYLQEQLDLYKEGLEKRYFLVEGALSRYTYLNAVTAALVSSDWEWAEHVIHTYRDALPEPQRESLYSFNLARLEYRRGQLDHALQLLQKAEYKDPLLGLAAKTLQLKIFYELELFDLLESHLQAIQAYIRRNKVMGYHRENYLNTVLFTRKLLEIPPHDKPARAALRTVIEQTKAVAEKEWLLEKAARGK